MAKLKYSKEEIINMVKGMFPNKTIMFMYYCGSIAYGTFDENSDIDVSVIMADINGKIHMEVEDLDIFVYGRDCYLDKQRLSPNIPLYNKMHIDDVLEIEKNLIYLNPKYEAEYNAYKNINLENNLKDFLDCFLTYHEMRLEQKPGPAKRL